MNQIKYIHSASRLALAAVLVACLSNFAAAGPIVVGNGAGESEYSLVFSRTYLVDLLNLCTPTVCPLDTVDVATLEKIKQAAANPPVALFFTTAEVGPKIFDLHALRNEVWFNQDLLWLDSAHTQAFDIPTATSVWIDVLGQLMQMQPKDLVTIKDAIQEVTGAHLNTFHAEPRAIADFSALIWKTEAKHDRLFLRAAGSDSYDATPLLEESLDCKGIDGLPRAVSRFRLFSLRWQPLALDKNGVYALDLAMIATWTCEGQDHRARLDLTGTGTQALPAPNSKPNQILIETLRAFVDGD